MVSLLSGIEIGIAAIAGLMPLIVLLGITGNGGSIQGSSAIQVKGTSAGPGTAGVNNTVQGLAITITGSAQEALGYGTSSGNIDTIVCQDRTLAASANEVLNLNSGTLFDIFNQAAVMAHLKYVAIYIVTGGDVNGLLIASNTTTPFVGYGINATGALIYPNGPGFQGGEPTVGIACGSAACSIKITNESSVNPVTYRVCFGGTST